MIQQGQALPAATLSELTADGMVNHQVTELFADKKVVLFAVPGAFTPTCSEAHLPGYVVLADQLKAKGVDLIACVSVNDAFVMQAWGEAQNASELLMLGDGDASFTKSTGSRNGHRRFWRRSFTALRDDHRQRCGHHIKR